MDDSAFADAINNALAADPTLNILDYYQETQANDQQRWQNQLNQLGNPTNYLNNILSKYSSSPMAQQQVQGAMGSANQAQAASGVAGNPQLTQALQGNAQNLAYKGQNNYLNATLQNTAQDMNLHSAMATQAEHKRQMDEKSDEADKDSTMSTIGSIAALAIMFL
jgi:hypothetical protein